MVAAPAWHPFSTHGRALRSLLLAGLLLGALANVGSALAIVWRPDEARYGEAILYAQAGRLLVGQPLYQPIDRMPYTVTAYTPVYYYLAAGLRAVFGAGFAPGRLLSLCAGLVATGLVGDLTWSRTRAVWPALVAGSLFLGLGMVGPLPWFAFYKEDLLGVALALGALAVVSRGTSHTRVVTAALLGALAILTKQTLFGPALIIAIWLAASHRRLAVLFCAVVLLVVVGVSLAFEVTTHAFVANTVLANVNPLGLGVLVYNLKLLVLFQTGPVLVAAPCLLPRLRLNDIRRDLLVGAWVVSLIPLLGLAKEGADFNYWQLFAASTAVLAATSLWERRSRPSEAWSLLALGINAAAGLVALGMVVVGQPELVRPSQAADSAFRELVASARAEPGAVLADPLDITALAGRPIVLEPVIYDLLEELGLWSSAPVVDSICRGEVSLLVLGYPLESATEHEVEDRWPPNVLAALRQQMTLQTVVSAGAGQRFIYRAGPPRAFVPVSPEPPLHGAPLAAACPPAA